jgi:NAD(P)-dependent dehydrogenase (short-subunit alcohol dehydrogenase family)
MADDRQETPEVLVEGPPEGIGSEIADRLRTELGACPDVAFAHLARVTVTGDGGGPQPSLFVWLEPAAVGSLRSALNLVSEAVARALPEDVCLDVLILNSAPELLADVERAGRLVAERDPDEHRRALIAAGLEAPRRAGRSRPAPDAVIP